MKEEEGNQKTCSCCSNSYSVLLGRNAGKGDDAPEAPRGMDRSDFFKVIGAGILGLSTVAGTDAFAATKTGKSTKMIKGQSDRMIIDDEMKELRISATVTKDPSQPSVADWGRRFQAFFGAKGGKMEPYFVFTTDVSRVEIDKALRELGVKSRRQIPMSEVQQRTGLKPTTSRDDYLDGDPMIVLRLSWTAGV